MSDILINDAKVMAKGQVTIPKNIRAALGVSTGDPALVNRTIYTLVKTSRNGSLHPAVKRISIAS